MDKGDKYIVRVHGWIMCRKIEAGDYRIEIKEYRGPACCNATLVADFYKPKGWKLIARHFVYDIMIHEKGEQLNFTEILRKVS